MSPNRSDRGHGGFVRRSGAHGTGAELADVVEPHRGCRAGTVEEQREAVTAADKGSGSRSHRRRDRQRERNKQTFEQVHSSLPGRAPHAIHCRHSEICIRACSYSRNGDQTNGRASPRRAGEPSPRTARRPRRRAIACRTFIDRRESAGFQWPGVVPSSDLNRSNRSSRSPGWHIGIRSRKPTASRQQRGVEFLHPIGRATCAAQSGPEHRARQTYETMGCTCSAKVNSFWHQPCLTYDVSIIRRRHQDKRAMNASISKSLRVLASGVALAIVAAFSGAAGANALLCRR